MLLRSTMPAFALFTNEAPRQTKQCQPLTRNAFRCDEHKQARMQGSQSAGPDDSPAEQLLFGLQPMIDRRTAAILRRDVERARADGVVADHVSGDEFGGGR
jgi:hypothetical protein